MDGYELRSEDFVKIQKKMMGVGGGGCGGQGGCQGRSEAFVKIQIQNFFWEGGWVGGIRVGGGGQGGCVW